MTELEYLRSLVNTYFKCEIEGKSRKRYISYARKVYFKLAIEMQDRKSYEVISKCINRDHSTCVHSLKTFHVVYDEHIEGYNNIKESNKFLFKKRHIRPSREKRTQALKLALFYRNELNKIKGHKLQVA